MAPNFANFMMIIWNSIVQKFVEYSSKDWDTEWYLQEVDTLTQDEHISSYEWMTKEEADRWEEHFEAEEEFGRRLASRRRTKPRD